MFHLHQGIIVGSLDCNLEIGSKSWMKCIYGRIIQCEKCNLVMNVHQHFGFFAFNLQALQQSAHANLTI